MLREVTNWNPNVDSEVAGRMVNNRMRQIIDRRSWYATKVRGVANVPNVIMTGTATVTYNSESVLESEPTGPHLLLACNSGRRLLSLTRPSSR